MARPGPILLADIGGTNARFVLFENQQFLSEPTQWPASDYPDLSSAMRQFLEGHLKEGMTLSGAAVCAAGPVSHGEVNLTNSPWTVRASDIAAVTGVPDAIVVNDFTALAMGIPFLAPDHLDFLGGGEAEANTPIGVMGPGTGLGVSALIPDGHGSWIPIAGEGGHVDLAPANDREIEILRHLMEAKDHVSAEAVLSGPGLEDLYMAMATLQGLQLLAKPAAADIHNHALQGDDALACECIAIFTRWLGAVAGNLALTLGAKGGVYIAGGILPKWGALFDKDLFRQGFEAKGRFVSYLQPIPTYLVTGGQPALLGLGELWRKAHQTGPRPR